VLAAALAVRSPSVKPTFAKIAADGPLTLSATGLDSITALRLRNALWQQEGVQWVQVKRQDVEVPTGVRDDRQAVGVICKPTANAASEGFVVADQLAEGALGRIRAIPQLSNVTVRAMAGGMFLLALGDVIAADVAKTAANQLSTLPFIEWAEPDYLVDGSIVPNDPFYNLQWNMSGTWGINGPSAWDITTGSPSVIVAVIDTGILRSQPDLSAKILPGYDFISSVASARDGNGRDADPSDEGTWGEAGECGSAFKPSSWHGSHVAGIVGASTNNSYGVAGVAWGAKILPIRVLGKCGLGATSDIIDGMYWAAGLPVPGVPANPNPARILNMSLGSRTPQPTCSTSYQTAVQAINNAGKLIVVSAGNNATSGIGEAGFYEPAGCPGVISVAATDHLGHRSSYSDYSTQFVVDVSAPGGDISYYQDQTVGIYSTIDAGTRGPTGPRGAYYQGTSQAAPHIAGTLALMLSANPALSNNQLYMTLVETAKEFNPVSECYRSTFCGLGIVNAHAAVLRGLTDPANAFTDITIASTLNPATVGQDFTIQATVTPSNVSGTVTLLLNGDPVSGCTSMTLTSGKTGCTFSNAPANSAGYYFSAVYNGDYTHHYVYADPIYQVVNTSGSSSGGTTAIEYYHASFGHYFVTVLADEIAKLDNGTFVGWARTGYSFKVYPLGTSGTQSVCRFFTTAFAPKSSHFYTPSASECATVNSNPNWTYEALVFGFVAPTATGSCATGTVPLYRLYNNGKSGAPNHRYTTNTSVRSTMIGQGWIPEGNGSLGVIGCVPA